MRSFFKNLALLFAGSCFLSAAQAQVVINEIHYHPVENPTFDANGNPIFSDTGLPADLSSDVHEFIELLNAGSAPVDLSKWKISSGVSFTFPKNTTIAAGGFVVVAANPARLQTVYGITGVLGPYTGHLSNGGDKINLKDSAGNTIDSVSYSNTFPWPITADSLAADDVFTGLNSANYQYKGRSLQRVCPTAPSNDPANWVAVRPAVGGAAFADLPTPGKANLISRSVPKPVVVAYSAVQSTDESTTIRAGVSVAVTCAFSSTASLANVNLEYFVDILSGANAFSETRTFVPMTALGGGRFTATLPGQVDRTLVRYRIEADRGDGLELVGPRADDPAIVPVGPPTYTAVINPGPREAWYAYFVSPQRTSVNPIYDVLLSDDGTTVDDNTADNTAPFNGLNGYQAIAFYCKGSPEKRVTGNDATGQPRQTPYVASTDRIWDGTVPGVLVVNGVPSDMQIRFHRSRYNRFPSSNSFQVSLPDFNKLNVGFATVKTLLDTEKDDTTVTAQGLFVAAGLPVSPTRYVDWYFNNNGMINRLEYLDYDSAFLDSYHAKMQRLNPGSALEANGQMYKSQGVIDSSPNVPTGEGPYGNGNERPLPAIAASGSFTGWTPIIRYSFTYGLHSNGYVGSLPFENMINGLWAARGDVFTAPNPNITALTAWYQANWDIATDSTATAINNWMVPWDDTTQNHFIWQRANGLWSRILWDFDGVYGISGITYNSQPIYTSSIYNGEVNDPATNADFRGPNWLKDSFFKACRAQYNQQLWVTNNTLLDPENLQTLTYLERNGVVNTYYNWINGQNSGFPANRFAAVNTALNLGVYYKPNRPVNQTPPGGASVLFGASLSASAYLTSSAFTHAAAPTPAAQASAKWQIRSANSTYDYPVYLATSTTNLTSLPIPFAQLQIGQTYFWTVTYIDVNGHPSIPSAETSFVYGEAPVTSPIFSVDATTLWKWDNTDQFNDQSWAQPAFVDTAWPSGAAVLGTVNTSEGNPASLTPSAPLRTSIAQNSRSAFYFRRHFTFNGNPTTAGLSLKFIIDDGCVVYLNGKEIYRLGMPSGTIAYATLASRNVGTYAWEGPFSIPSTALVTGDNVIAVEVHQSTTSSSDFLMGLELDGFDGAHYATAGPVVLNEICASNHDAAHHGSDTPDYVELYNTSATSTDISGWALTNDPLQPALYSFPAGTVIPAQSYLVVWCDSDLVQSGLHTGFPLSKDGESLLLLHGGSIVDTITYGPQALDIPIGRVPTGTGAWVAIQPSPGAANVAAALGSSSNLKVNEWSGNASHGNDWFELYNPGSAPVALTGLWLSNLPGTPEVTQIPPLSFVAGHGFTVFTADGTTAGGNHCNFKLGAGGTSIVLTAIDGLTPIDQVTFGAQQVDVTQGRLPDGGATIVSFSLTASPAASNWLPAPVAINEALTNPVAPFEYAIELLNPTAAAVTTGGWWLSDDASNFNKYQISANASIAPAGFQVFYASQFNSPPGGPSSVALNPLGGQLYLSAVDGNGNLTGYRSQVSYGAAAANVSFGNVPTGNPRGATLPEFWPQAAHTFGQDTASTTPQFETGLGLANAAPQIGPVIINEIMYHPQDGAGGADDTLDEYIELQNTTTVAQNVSGWQVQGGSTYTFPVGTAIRPSDYVLLVSFDPVHDTASLNAFLAHYGLGTGTRLYGPCGPSLANSGQTVELDSPGAPINGVTPYIMVDRVTYSDAAPWPTQPDGGGQSLQRISRSIIGNDVAIWSASTATPGKVNAGETPILSATGDGIPDSWAIANGFDPFDPTVPGQDADGDGMTNLQEYLAGTNPRDPTSVFTATVSPAAGGGYTIQFTAMPGKTYTVQYTDNLNNAWQTLGSVSAQATQTPISVTDSNAAGQRFYRVATPASP